MYKLIMYKLFVMTIVDGAVALAFGDQISVERISGYEGSHQGKSQANPKKRRSETGMYRAGNSQNKTIVGYFHRRDRRGIGGKSNA